MHPGGIAHQLGISPGDRLLEINGCPVRDYLDFLFFSSDPHLEILVETSEGRVLFEVDRESEPLGLEVEQIVPRRCRCRCIFCFMDQMPPGLRRTLYLKDDDYRLSFLYGNYITLVGMTDEDYKRIGEQRLSPLYVSVHTTNPQLRAFMMGTPEAAFIMEGLSRLVGMGVVVHAQVVVCPGINDGKELERTLVELAGLYPGVRSVAVVPVGITRFRGGLFPLFPVCRMEARGILQTVLSLGGRFLKELGTRFAFPADELFIKAGEPIPPEDFYEGFFQVEDGVGMVRLFFSRLKRVEKRLRGVFFVTGEAFAPFLEAALVGAGVSGARVLPVKNRFFGELVSVAGLLVASDVKEALSGRDAGLVVVPDVIANDDGLTIDGVDVSLLGDFLGVPCEVVPSHPEGFWDAVAGL